MTAGWELRTSPKFDQAIQKFDRSVARAVIGVLEDVAATGDPRVRGRALSGDRRWYWRYRVDDYRVIANIDDAGLLLVALDVGHRSAIYRRR